jgi:hypothetical protein
MLCRVPFTNPKVAINGQALHVEEVAGGLEHKNTKKKVLRAEARLLP